MKRSLHITSAVSLIIVATVLVIRTQFQLDSVERDPVVPSHPVDSMQGGSEVGRRGTRGDLQPDWTSDGRTIALQMRLAIEGHSLSEIETVQLLEAKLSEGLISDEQFSKAAYWLSMSLKEMDPLLRLLAHFEVGELYEQIAKAAFGSEVLRDRKQIEKLSRVLDGILNDSLRLSLLSSAARQIEFGPNTEELLAVLIGSSYSSEEQSAILRSLALEFGDGCGKPADHKGYMSMQDVYQVGRQLIEVGNERSRGTVTKRIAGRAFSENGVTELKNAAVQTEIPFGALVTDLLSWDDSGVGPAEIVDLVAAMDPADPFRDKLVNVAVARLSQSGERGEFDQALAILPLTQEERSRLTDVYKNILK